MLKEGDLAPDFCLESDEGRTVCLKDLRGKKVVLYFYPKDDSSGCTKEAISFKEVHGELEGLGAVVVGISPDGVESHRKFKAKHGLPFVLLSDPDGAVARAFGAWGEKSMYGKKFEGVIRSTFLLDEEGRVVKAYRKVKPEGHGKEVLSCLMG